MIAKGCLHIAILPMPFLIASLILIPLTSFFIYPLSLFLILQIFFLFFFRDMPRKVEDGIVSPADGKVIHAEKNRVAIFMSLFDMHVNLMPYDGRIAGMKHYPGRHAPAYGDVGKNERLEIEVETDMGKMKIIQIAGMVARRIVPYVREGEFIKKGEKIGIIRFGSRVDVILRDGCRVLVRKGEKIKAGERIAISEKIQKN